MKHNRRVKNTRYLLIISSMMILLACQTLVGGPVAVPTETARDALNPVAAPTLTPFQDSTEPIDLGVTTPQPPSTEPGLLCLGTTDFGVICWEDNEWRTYSKDTGDLRSNIVDELALCSDNSVVALGVSGFSVYQNATWQTYESGWGNSSADGIACAPNGDMWIAHFKGVTRFDGTHWTTYDALEYLSPGPDSSDLVKDVLVTPEGTVWVVTASSVARFAHDEWTTYQQGFGFDDRQFFANVALDAFGATWVSSNEGVFKFDGENWHLYPNDDLITAASLTVDYAGRIWLGSSHQGVFMFADNQWHNYTYHNSDLASNRVRDIAVDGRGRVWIGTEWGLNVVTEDETWQTYRMDNSAMIDHDIEAVIVVDGGPSALPPTEVKAAGALSGKIVTPAHAPLRKATIETCVEGVYSTFYGATPCADQPFIRTTTSDAEGYFEFTDLPPGRYVIAIWVAEEWTRLTDDFGIATERFRVYPEQHTALGDVVLGAE